MAAAEQQPPERARRRRLFRPFRPLRPLRPVFLILLVVGAAGVWAVRSGRLEDVVAKRLLRAAAAAGYDLSFSRVEISLVPPGLEVHDLALAQRDAEQSLLTADRIEIVIAARSLLAGKPRIARAEVHRPVLRWPGSVAPRDEAKGPLVLPEFQGYLRRIQISEGLILLPEGVLPVSGEATGFAVQARAGEEGLSLHLLAESLRLQMPGSDGVWSGRAEGHAMLQTDRVLVDRFRWAATDTALEASGSVTLGGAYDFRAEGEIDASRIREWGIPVPVSGRVTVDADLRGQGREATASARFRSSRLEVNGREVLGLSGELTWKPSGVGGQARFRLLEGSTVLDYRMNREAGGLPDHRLVLTLSDIDLARGLDVVGIPGLPWNARVGGRAEAHWAGTDLSTLQGQSDLSLRPGTVGDGEREYALAGEVSLELDSGELRVRSAELRGEAASMWLTGRFREGAGEAAFQVETARPDTVRIGYLQPLLEQMAEEVNFPDLSALAGDFRIEGRVLLGNGGATADGVLRGSSVVWAGTTLGDVSAHLEMDSDRLRLREVSLSGDGGLLEAEGEVWLEPEQRGRLEARVRLQDLALEDWVRQLTGRPSPVEGRARGIARIVRHGCGVEGRVSLSLDDSSILGSTAGQMRAELRMGGGELRLVQAEARYGGGLLRAYGGLTLLDTPAVDLAFSATGLSVSQLRAGRALPFLGGILDLDGRLVGPLDDPRLNARLAYHGPDGEPADLGEAELRVDGPLGELTLEGEAPRHRLTLLGTAGLSSGLPVALNLRAEGLDLSLLGKVLELPLKEDLYGAADLRAAVFGPLESPSQMRAEARISGLRVDTGGYELRNAGPLSFGWNEGVAVLRPSRLVGEGTDLVVRGRSEPGALGLESELDGEFDLRILQALDPRMRLSGEGSAALKLDTRAGYSGSLTIRDGSLGYEGLPVALDAVQATAEFQGPDLTLTRLEGRVGGGEVSGSGFVRFDGLTPASLRVELHGEDARVTYPADLESVADFRLLLEDAGEGYRLSGDIDLLRGIYRLPLDQGNSLLPAESRASLPLSGGLRAQGGKGEQVRLDIRMEAPHSLYLRSRDVNVEAQGSLHLGGTLSTPEITGRIDALEGGVIRFRDVRYNVIGGFVDFAEFGGLDPFFRLDASTTIRDYEVILSVDGHLSDLTFELTSYPPLQHDEILILLVTGNTPDEIAAKGGTAVLSEQVANALSAPIGGGLAQALGLTQVRVEPVDQNGQARLTIVKEVNPNLRVTFSDDFQTAGNQIYRVEYDVTRKLEMIAFRDETGGLGGDFRYTTRGYSYPRPEADRQSGPRVGKVILSGEPPELTQRLRKRIRVKEGKVYRRSAAVDSVDRLRTTLVRRGYLQSHVEAEDSTEGEVVEVRFLVHPGPRHELRLTPDLPKEKKLRKRLQQAFRRALMPSDPVQEGRRAIERFYGNRGYPRVEVEGRLEEVREDHHVLVFDVAPGPRTRVAEIRFEGNTSFSGERLERLMATRTASGGRRGWLNGARLDEDLDALRIFYRARGYPDVQIPAPRIDPVEGDTGRKERALVVVTIHEGEQWRVGEVAFEGNQAFDDAALLGEISLRPGHPITREGLDSARTAVRLRYDAAGFDEARVTYSVDGDDPGARLLTFRIEEGEAHRVGEIRVTGNGYTRDRVIWRELQTENGEPLSRDRLLAAQRRLGRLGIFRSVEVRAEAEEAGEEIPVEVEVREAPNIRTSFGVGWDTESGPRGFFQIRDNNLFGRNQTLGAVLSASDIYRRIRFSFLEPRLFGRELEGLLTASWSEDERISFDERRVAFSPVGTRKVGPYRFIVGYTIEDVTLTNVQFLSLEDKIEDVRLGSINGTVLRDRRDDPFNPRRGMFYSLDLRLFDRYLGSERDFVKFFGQVTYFRPITERSFWAVGFRAGLQEPFSDSVIPINERFFAGGDSTIRGFPRDTVGPKDPVSGSPIGGNALLILNLEYHFPIKAALGGVLFLDLGNVYPTIDSIDALDVRKVLGAGLHYRTPLGPLRLEYGRKLDPRKGESSGELFFTIGLAF